MSNKILRSKTPIVISTWKHGLKETKTSIKLLENNVEPDDILCITFTDKARKKMYDEILIVEDIDIIINIVIVIISNDGAISNFTTSFQFYWGF